MHLEEKLDRLKASLSPMHLVIRYNDSKKIMSKIESVFLQPDVNHKYSAWKERLKKYEEYNFNLPPFQFLKTKLVENQKYWWIFLDNNHINTKHRIFDATPFGGESLAALFYADPVFIVPKKYEWMLVIDREHRLVRRIQQVDTK